jgi:hypothetical protein
LVADFGVIVLFFVDCDWTRIEGRGRGQKGEHTACVALAGFLSKLFVSTYIDDNVRPKPPRGSLPDDVERAEMYGCAEIRYSAGGGGSDSVGRGQQQRQRGAATTTGDRSRKCGSSEYGRNLYILP